MFLKRFFLLSLKIDNSNYSITDCQGVWIQDEDRHYFGPDLGPNCLQKLSAEDKGKRYYCLDTSFFLSENAIIVLVLEENSFCFHGRPVHNVLTLVLERQYVLLCVCNITQTLIKLGELQHIPVYKKS